MKRRPPRPERHIESIEIRTTDGVCLRGTVREPVLRPQGTALLAHAEFASRSEFAPAGDEGRGLAPFLVSQGWRAVAFDFRGHGESVAPREATYDDFIRHDLAAVAECARARWQGPLIAVGHALGGHVALAGVGTSCVDVDAIVAVATNVWLPRFEPSALRWQAKRAAMEFVAAVVEKHGHFPARAMGLGTENESAALMRAAVRTARHGTWQSDDGRTDYESALGNVRIPVLSIASASDKLRCVPDCAERMLGGCAGVKDFHLVARDDRGGSAPGHMALITGRRSFDVWDAIAAWMNAR